MGLQVRFSLGKGFYKFFKWAKSRLFANVITLCHNLKGQFLVSEALKLYEAGKEGRVIKLEGLDGYAGEIQHLVDCIRGQQPPSMVTAEDGFNAIRICEAEERSVQTGTLQEL